MAMLQHMNPSSRKLCDQLIDVNDDIIDAGSDRSLGLQHPFYELVKSIGVRRIGPSWPFYLGIYYG